MLPWVICECCAKLWSRRDLGQDRAHRVGKLMTRGDHPQLEQQLLVKKSTAQDRTPTCFRAPTFLLRDQMERDIAGNADKIPEDNR